MSTDTIDLTGILARHREFKLEDELAAAKRTIAYMLEACKQARQDCMHPRSVQAQLLDAAIERAQGKR